MKKILVLLLAAVLSAASLAGCGSGNKDIEAPPAGETSTQSGETKARDEAGKNDADGKDKQTGAEADGEKADETDKSE